MKNQVNLIDKVHKIMIKQIGKVHSPEKNKIK